MASRFLSFGLNSDDVAGNDPSVVATLVGGKGAALARMAAEGIPIPETICISFDAYDRFVEATRLRERINFELNRKDFDDMRWEEVWDTALRIRNLFAKTAIPDHIVRDLTPLLDTTFGRRATAVRSSAAGEDSGAASFAGLHDSFVNVRGIPSVLDHVKLVWASLWSDRALIYRRELGLDIARSRMAVLVQEVIAGECSGVVFSQSPSDETHTVIEAVHGLNMGLVDGAVEPDRWTLSRAEGTVLKHQHPQSRSAMRTAPDGSRLEKLDSRTARTPPLGAAHVAAIHELAHRAERLFGAPQDVEWTFRDGELWALQSRPVTTLESADEGDKRPWYLSLTRSVENLESLRRVIEEEILPGMERDAARLAEIELEKLTDSELAAEIGTRAALFDRWKAAYWRDCIPFAHGMRLFGQVYNDAVRPADPFEFVDLLRSGRLAGMERNARLEKLAAILRPHLPAQPAPIEEVLEKSGSDFRNALDEFLDDFGAQFASRVAADQETGARERRALSKLIVEMARSFDRRTPGDRPHGGRTPRTELEQRFLKCFPEETGAHAAGLLDLARASYQLRDDDNISLNKVDHQLERALHEGRRRLARRWRETERARCDTQSLEAAEIRTALEDAGYEPRFDAAGAPEAPGGAPGRRCTIEARQLVGQPAGPGMVRGPARVILGDDDLFDFKSGEILVCDAVSPDMTFLTPLAAGIIERRGGMLIHGAIIAREYGIPCVTGVPRATDFIRTGDRVTVDGYLGIVICAREDRTVQKP